jgi:hypothetical protein
MFCHRWGVVLQNFPQCGILNKCTSVLHRSLLCKGKAAGITNWQWNACLQLEIPIQIGAEWEAINCKKTVDLFWTYPWRGFALLTPPLRLLSPRLKRTSISIGGRHLYST